VAVLKEFFESESDWLSFCLGQHKVPVIAELTGCMAIRQGSSVSRQQFACSHSFGQGQGSKKVECTKFTPREQNMYLTIISCTIIVPAYHCQWLQSPPWSREWFGVS